MSDLSEYETVVSLAVDMAKVTTRERILTTEVWKPFTLLYVEMVKRKEITPLVELPEEKKRELWDLTHGERWKRIMVCQAVYIFDLITEK